MPGLAIESAGGEGSCRFIGNFHGIPLIGPDIGGAARIAFGDLTDRIPRGGAIIVELIGPSQGASGLHR